MRPISTLLLTLLTPTALALAVPSPKNAAQLRSSPGATVGDHRRSPSVEGAGQSGGDDDDAIAYAWYDEDEKAA
ncbi:hypothetical protein CHGG_06033 [Chaetomium globosum CBS 148.51]|uniref:Uncharacterized protein n=1 Tax=Chaetomium globosum (strain ATCC 6205 / CBS 148.51 / DSM 1962 / NBRC 6347 / NRRL 1970) TaxID=306901 RepID=Q2H5N2_CHAGB|nr:uncharacterized protein CHGG_06033 [Chaetomium globosum CBS 148.51]EAQ89414.1 hypothetical protein CHGG_06033 [Chaetomium globosum CBS 148.51]